MQWDDGFVIPRKIKAKIDGNLQARSIVLANESAQLLDIPRHSTTKSKVTNVVDLLRYQYEGVGY